MRLPKHHKAGLGQKGVAIILVVGFILFVILAMFAFAIDFAYVYTARGELQNLADSAALAGGGVLTGTSFSDQPALDAQLASVRAEAREYAAQNKAAGGVTVPLEDADIRIGCWDAAASPPFKAVSTVSDVDLLCPSIGVNAVWVNAVMYDSRGNPVDLLFGDIVGRDSMDVNRIAVAQRTPGPTSALSMCILTCDLDVPPNPNGGLVLFLRQGDMNDVYNKQVGGGELKYSALVNAVDAVINSTCAGMSGNTFNNCRDAIKYPGEKIPAFTEFKCTQPPSGLGGLIDEYIKGEQNPPNVCGECITTTRSQTFMDLMYETYIKKQDADGNWRVITPVVNSASPGFLCPNCSALASTTPACSPEGQGANDEPYLVERYAEILINGVTDETGSPLDFNFIFNGVSYPIDGDDVRGPTVRIADIECVPCPATDLLSQRVQLVK